MPPSRDRKPGIPSEKRAAPQAEPTRDRRLRLPEDLASALDAVAEKTGASSNSLVVEAVRDALRHPDGPWTRRATDLRKTRHAAKQPQPEPNCSERAETVVALSCPHGAPPCQDRQPSTTADRLE